MGPRLTVRFTTNFRGAGRYVMVSVPRRLVESQGEAGTGSSLPGVWVTYPFTARSSSTLASDTR